MAGNARDNILKKIKEALSTPTPIPFAKSEGQSDMYTPLFQEPEIEFAEKFVALQGKFAYCISDSDLKEQVNALVIAQKWEAVYCREPRLVQVLGHNVSTTDSLAGCEAAVTGCEYLIARTGSIVLSAAQESGRATSVYAPVHICVAYTSQVLPDIKNALENVKNRSSKNMPSLITFATGPSRTADIEKTLVVGVHGPKEVYVFLVDDTNQD